MYSYVFYPWASRATLYHLVHHCCRRSLPRLFFGILNDSIGHLGPLPMAAALRTGIGMFSTHIFHISHE
jgi:hypothetical protein